MKVEIDSLPDNPVLLKQMLRNLTAENTHLEDTHSKLKKDISYLEDTQSQLEDKYSDLKEKFKYLQRLYFGQKSEKLTKEELGQMTLFNEAEDGALAEEDECQLEEINAEEQNTTTVNSYQRKKRGRKPLPADLSRKEIIHDLDEDEKLCPCCGEVRPVMGEERTEELEIIPQQIYVNVHIRKKYGPCTCDAFVDQELPEVKTASAQKRIIPQSIVGNGLLAYTVVSKFCDALPFYRQSRIFNRLDIDLSRQTLCNWTLKAAEACKPLLKILEEVIAKGPVLRMDETPLQVLQEEGRPPTSKSYMWVTYGYGKNEHPLILYQYHPTRSGCVPRSLLESYTGYLQSDGYAGYNFTEKDESKITHVGCFAHARRKFEKAYRGNKKSKLAFRGIEYVKELYRIETEMRLQYKDHETFIEKRKETVKPVLEKFRNWMNENEPTVLPSSDTAKAISYTIKRWDSLKNYLEHHLLTPDNNLVENAIRPFTVGRKNWLFSNTPGGAHASACFYTLIECAKANKLNPYNYLLYIFGKIPECVGEENFRKLLPDMLTPEMIKPE